jgi:hypothetical protein
MCEVLPCATLSILAGGGSLTSLITLIGGPRAKDGNGPHAAVGRLEVRRWEGKRQGQQAAKCVVGTTRARTREREAANHSRNNQTRVHGTRWALAWIIRADGRAAPSSSPQPAHMVRLRLLSIARGVLA